jgi:hypothetical protein
VPIATRKPGTVTLTLEAVFHDFAPPDREMNPVLMLLKRREIASMEVISLQNNVPPAGAVSGAQLVEVVFTEN